MDKLERKMIEEILKNQFVFTHQLLIYEATLRDLLRPVGMSMLKTKHKCKLLEDSIKRTKKLLKDLRKESES